MNYHGSYRRLLGNSMSAMLGAIEIYNKPQFSYRDEIFSILVVNAWELLLKAIISRSRQSIYYRKQRGKPYRTLSCHDAFQRAAKSGLWPKEVSAQAAEANIELLSTYRDNSVHFYNDPEFGSVIYSLAQAAVVNYRDVARHVFGKDIAENITWRILPIGFDTPIDPVDFMRGKQKNKKKERSRAVQEFLAVLRHKTDELIAEGVATDRLIAVFDVSLQAIKKIDHADIVVGVTSTDNPEAIVIPRRVDPNETHPYRQKELLPRLKRSISSRTFQAIVYAHKLRDDPRYCWKDRTGAIVRWSPDTVRFVDSLSDSQVQKALAIYATQKERR